ncbi:hypothetical protein DSAG12_02257 [Promethearchaeum syntrophicum]|uniref:Uncharacterized protein n=1 Tax=Promethearchaeum syntrophicum TaxID=2594042 RepID=A0A5B9DC36_9ARCH|nr:hypothetical protein [Candidatus Prometheoarchaeum syntrophicum]QEE16427.1 hypothetical protein DSAG12_02257 [Candidatus Prometheoarchaeum syntrophicum]
MRKKKGTYMIRIKNRNSIKYYCIILIFLICTISFAYSSTAHKSDLNQNYEYIFNSDISADVDPSLYNATFYPFINLSLSFYKNGIIHNNDTNNIFVSIKITKIDSDDNPFRIKMELIGGFNDLDTKDIGIKNISNQFIWDLDQSENWLDFTSNRPITILNSGLNRINVKYDPIHARYYEYYNHSGVIERIEVDCNRNLLLNSRIILPETSSNFDLYDSRIFTKNRLGLSLNQIPENGEEPENGTFFLQYFGIIILIGVTFIILGNIIKKFRSY